MNTWTCQAKARKSKILELLEQKVRAKIAPQVGDTRGRVEAIDNSYADSLLDFEKKAQEGVLVTNSQLAAHVT